MTCTSPFIVVVASGSFRTNKIENGFHFSLAPHSGSIMQRTLSHLELRKRRHLIWSFRSSKSAFHFFARSAAVSTAPSFSASLETLLAQAEESSAFLAPVLPDGLVRVGLPTSSSKLNPVVNRVAFSGVAAAAFGASVFVVMSVRRDDP
jgi:hypothetical protein